MVSTSNWKLAVAEVAIGVAPAASTLTVVWFTVWFVTVTVTVVVPRAGVFEKLTLMFGFAQPVNNDPSTTRTTAPAISREGPFGDAILAMPYPRPGRSPARAPVS